MKLLLLVLTISSGLFAATIHIHSTGVDAGHTPLTLPNVGPNLAEIHFSLITGPGVGGAGANTLLTRWQAPYVSEVGVNARWISPARVVGAATTFPTTTGIYTLVQTFSMMGLDLSTAILGGRFAADNCAEIRLNGILLATTNGVNACGTSPHPTSNFTGWTTFNAPVTAFLANINTLQVRLLNDSSPTGVIVEFQRHTADEVPEPAVSALIGIGLAAIALRRKLA